MQQGEPRGLDGILGILQRAELAASLPGGLAARRFGPRPDEQGEIELTQRSTGVAAIITAFHAKYYAHELTRVAGGDDVERLSTSLFDASVDLNPHQIEAALFALRSPLSKGVVLADEVGLGKTIEAGLVLCQYWAERKRRLIVICPAALRRQWAAELSEKFNLSTRILDAQTVRQLRKTGALNPFDQPAVLILSYHYASRLEDDLRAVPWDLVVIDEAHKLRNAHQRSNRMGQTLGGPSTVDTSCC